MSDQTNTISLNKAKAWTKEWRDNESNYNSHNEVNGFLVPAEDLQEVLDVMKSQTGDKNVRVYLGVDDTNTERLVIVATIPETQADGTVIYKDLIYGEIDGKGVTDPNSTVNSGLFDFVKPCPPFCDPKSPLN